MLRKPIFEDNDDAIYVAQNPITNSISKHIDVRHQHIRREVVARDELPVRHSPSEFQHADILVKACDDALCL